MPRKISPFQLGLFFLIGAAIAVGALIWVGATHLFESGKMYVTFFQNSVAGLDPGASVRYLGIKVGRVTAVGIAADRRLIRVEMMMNPKFSVKGMAVTLSQQGIMGPVFVGINQAPANINQVTPRITFPHKYPLIPSHPGEFTRIEDALEKIVHQIEAMDLKGLVLAWQKTAQDANALIKDQEIRATIHNLKEISGDIKNLVMVLGEPGNPQKWQKSFANLAATAAAARTSTEALATRLQKIPPEAIPEVTRQLEQTLFQVSQVLANLKGLVHEMREEPGRILVTPREREPFRK
jgi:phospholipid/cholesterol/gamma-HCH transport system substrate-binding protein